MSGNQFEGNDNDVHMKESGPDTKTSDDSQTSESETQEMENTNGQQQESKSEITISGSKFFVHVTGKTLNAERKVIDHLKKQIPCLEEVEKVDECDFILVFCPVVSRAGTDIEAAVKKLKQTSCTEKETIPAFLVVLHHTFDKELIVPESWRSITRRNSVTVDCLFHEDLGFLECHKNQKSLATITDIIETQVSTSWRTFSGSMKDFTCGLTEAPYRFWSSVSEYVPSLWRWSVDDMNAGKQNDEQSKWTKPNENAGGASSLSDFSQLRLLLLGKTGSGKTKAQITILSSVERNQASASTPTSTATQQSERTHGEVSGRKVTVVDTPDLFSPGFSLEKLRQDVGFCVHLSVPGPHAFLLVINVNHSTGAERGTLDKMEDVFGERCWRNTMIIFSVTDEVQKTEIEEFIQSGDQEIQRLVEKCGNRFHCLNIKESGDGSQVSELLEKIEKMMEGSREKFYSSEMHQEKLNTIDEIEMMIREKIRKFKNLKRKYNNEQAEDIEQTGKRQKENSGMMYQEVHVEAMRNEMLSTLSEMHRCVLTMQEDFNRQMEENEMKMDKQLEENRQVEEENKDPHSSFVYL